MSIVKRFMMRPTGCLSKKRSYMMSSIFSKCTRGYLQVQ